MSRARHAKGGKAEPKPYNAQGSEVEKEADEKAHGGKVKKVDGGAHKPAHKRMDRPGRKRGGRAGADMSPLSTASKVTNAGAHKADTGNADEGP